MPDLDGERTALDRMTRTMYFAIGIATIIFGVLLARGDSGFLGQIEPSSTLRSCGSASFISLVLAGHVRGARTRPAAHRDARARNCGRHRLRLVPNCFFRSRSRLKRSTSNASPWMQGFGAIPATLIAVAWGGRITWVFALSQGPIVVLVGLAATDESAIKAVLEGLGATVTLLDLRRRVRRRGDGRRTARRRGKDSARAGIPRGERAHSRARAVAHQRDGARRHHVRVALSNSRARATRASRRKRAAPSPRSRNLRVRALPASRTRRRSSLPCCAQPSATRPLTLTSPTASMPMDSVPREVAAALSEATEEAIRNSLLHAGDGATRAVTVTLAPTGVDVVVEDNGVGFSPRDVPQRRLGLRVSILERMRTLPGGDARVRSKVGAGTRISLTWRRS